MSASQNALTPHPLWAGRVLALLGIVLLAFSLRTAVASLSPVLLFIGEDMAVPSAVVGLLGTAPPVAFAVFGIVAPMLERRLGLQTLTTVALVVITAGLVVRALAPNATTLLVATIGLFAGVAVGNVLLPPLVRRYFPDRMGLVTTVYATALSMSSFVPPLVAVPVAEALDWRVSLGMWAAVAGAALVPWIALLVAERRTPSSTVDVPQGAGALLGRLVRLPLTWALIGSFLVTSSTAYVAFAWLPMMLVELTGMSPTSAGALLAAFSLMGLPASLFVPVLLTRWPRIIGPLIALAVVSGLVAYAGLLLAPALAVLWVFVLGIPPLLFPLTLFLVGKRTRTHQTTVALSSFVQSLGYGATALFPLAVGILHGVSGGWTSSLLLMLVTVLVGVPAGIVITRTKTVEDEWERRHGAW